VIEESRPVAKEVLNRVRVFGESEQVVWNSRLLDFWLTMPMKRPGVRRLGWIDQMGGSKVGGGEEETKEGRGMYPEHDLKGTKPPHHELPTAAAKSNRRAIAY
jgi:hypothetical protein